MRLGMPKYREVWSSLTALGFLSFGIQKIVPEESQFLCFNLGATALAVAMGFLVAGMVAERRENGTEEKGKRPSSQQEGIRR